jgi:hypothetical protein
LHALGVLASSNMLVPSEPDEERRA